MQVEAYLFFGGECEEALRFYEKALGGRIENIMRYEGSPMDNGSLPAGYKQKVMHATFDAKGTRFMASDGMPGQPKQNYGGFAMSLYVPGGDASDARRAFEALSEGGKITMPFEPPFWGGHFGMLVDKFGVPWMVSSEH